jgi:hypothetical protein
MAIKKREDAERTLAHHQARHPSMILRLVSILTMFSQTDTSEAAEFWVLNVWQPILAAAAFQAASLGVMELPALL